MTAEQLVTLLGLLITAGATVIVAVIASRSSKKVSKEQNAVTFSQHLIDRIEGLEKRNDDLETKFDNLQRSFESLKQSFTTAINFIERMVLWARGGSKPPMPSIPKSLMAHFDPSLIEEHLEHQEAE